ncbi:MAG: MFS transporter [Candidatus Kariarchaeaceae archaeon]|jgi:MFS family permease
MGIFSFSRFFGVENLTSKSRRFVYKFFFVSNLTKMFLLFSRTFYVLYVIDQVGIEKLALLFTVLLLVQAAIDFPTGALGDWIGERWVMAIAYGLHSVSYYLLITAEKYNDFLIVFVLEGIAKAQESGTLESWFDNNYKVVVSEEDPNRDVYLRISGKAFMTNDMIGASIAVLGGYLASNLSDDHQVGRQFVFKIQAYSMIVLALILLLSLNKYGKEVAVQKEGYFKLVGKGLFVIFKSPVLFFFVIGFVIDLMVATVWINLMMYPVYYGFAGSDFRTSIFSFCIFIFSIFFIGKSGEWARKMNPKVWIPITIFLQAALFYGGNSLILKNYVLEDKYKPIPLGFLLATAIIAALLLSIYKIQVKKLYLDEVPDENRNSFYSFLPTLALLSAALINYQASQYITIEKFADILILLGGMKVVGSIIMAFGLLFYKPKIDISSPLVKTELPYVFDSNLEGLDPSMHFFVPSSWYLSETIKRIWTTMLSSARTSGNIDEDGEKLLVGIMVDIDKYIQTLEKALEDGVLTNKEVSKLLKNRNEILKKAAAEAKKDDIVTESEKEILGKLNDILIELEKIEKITPKR